MKFSFKESHYAFESLRAHAGSLSILRIPSGKSIVAFLSASAPGKQEHEVTNSSAEHIQPYQALAPRGSNSAQVNATKPVTAKAI